VLDPVRAPELLAVREQIKNWRFYDQFRTDVDAPARQSQIGTRTPVLDAEGRDLAAALQTIIEIGEVEALHGTIEDAFPRSRVQVVETRAASISSFARTAYCDPCRPRSSPTARCVICSWSLPCSVRGHRH
jgi:predicted ATPase